MSAQEAMINLLCDYFVQRDVRFSRRNDGEAVESNLRGRTRSFRLVLEVEESADLLLLRVPMLYVPEALRPAMAEALTRANYSLCVGCFEMDLNDGELQFRSGFPLADGTITYQQFVDLIGSAHHAVDGYDRAFNRLLYGDDLSPAEVIAEVEMAN